MVQKQKCAVIGIRCVGKYVFENKLTDKTFLKIETLAGIKEINLKIKNSQVSSVSVCLGEFKVLDEFELTILDTSFTITPVLVGNPHAIIFVNDLSNIEINKYAPLIETHKNFPNRTNVEFVQIINPNLIKVKVWERGSGITLACGTGACAATAAAYTKKFIYKNPTVELPGGFLQTYINEKTNTVYLSGAAITVYTGKYFY